MIKTITHLTRLLIKSLNTFVSWLESKNHFVHMQSKFIDLAPIDEADKSGIYSEAILFATNNEKVYNIALTGPYGSGKSSIIQSFLKKYQRPALHISLAAFVPEADARNEEASRQEIEGSILQQMLYGADANRLPLSRFKRIQSPGVWSVFKSLYLMLGILALWYVFYTREEIISGKFFIPLSLSNWPKLGVFVFAATFLWVILHRAYVASFGLSLKSISLKNVEIKPAQDDQTSILNRHLDEIVYFFESTKYDLVIVEDLDRFEDAEIFVTLREINNLVNENAGVKRTIRFLYALRDDMFVNTDRTKFFEFIIPVIPIINTSNSIDMVLERGMRLDVDKRLDKQFLREVSRYLNDLRLIQNIFNEYAIYVANLETDGENLLDANKLLAILIYKNVYPRDFEQLHRGKGTLAEILNRQEEFIEDGEATYRAEVAELDKRLEIADRQTPSDLRELRQIYSMALIEKLKANVVRVSIDQQAWVDLPQLVSHGAFEQLIETSRLNSRTAQNQNYPVDVSKLQSEVDSQKSYQQRKEEIESKAADEKNKSLRRISELRTKIAALRTTKLNELLRLNADRVQDLFENFGENGELASFLILEGYIDDTYYQYTTLFHSGRLSPNDNKFLIQIRSFVTPEPVFPIDNPKEVVAAMRNEDFRQSYVLNVKLVDCLLSDPSLYFDQTQKLFQFLSSEFESCKDFFDAYYTSGRDVAGLLSGLANAWKGLVPNFITSPNSIHHVSQLLSNLTQSRLETLAKDFEELPEFVSTNLPEILVNLPELSPDRLALINFEVKELAAIQEHSVIVRFMFDKGLFELTIANLEFVYQAIMGEKDLKQLREKNLTTIRSKNNAALIQRIERDFDYYFRNVLLELDGNSKEEATAIYAVINHDDLELEEIRDFLERQTTLLPSLVNVPDRFKTLLFQLGKIEPAWKNCVTFMHAKDFEEVNLISYLERDFVRDAILEQTIPDDSDSFELRSFLLNAGSLSDSAYREYISALPKPFSQFPKELESSKLKILIDEGKVSFNKDSLEALSEIEDLQLHFVSNNIEAYLSEPDIYNFNDDLKEKLLRADIDILAKRRIVDLIDLGTLISLPNRAELIGHILNSTDNLISNINGIIAECLIINSKPIATQISLFNKCQSLMTKDEVRNVLAKLPKPFSDIKTGYNTPRLKNTPENQDLVRWLDSEDIISSWSENGFFTDDIRVNLYRR